MREDAAKSLDDETETQTAGNMIRNGLLEDVLLIIIAIRIGGFEYLKPHNALSDKQIDISLTKIAVKQEGLHHATHGTRIAKRMKVIVKRTDGSIMIIGRLDSRHDARQSNK